MRSLDHVALAHRRISAIPTVYAGTAFRSRLEARWAAFFDLCEWQWCYEPINLRGWIPDFSLRGAGYDIYVEVKPTTEFGAVFDKAIYAQVGNEILCLGREPVSLMSQVFDPMDADLGWLTERQLWYGDSDINLEGPVMSQGPTDWVGLAPFGKWIGEEKVGDASDRPGFCHEEGSYVDRITGKYDGGCFGADWVYDRHQRLQALWLQACRIVQWRPA